MPHVLLVTKENEFENDAEITYFAKSKPFSLGGGD